MALPPSGTVTFLFTDIEGSTALWERQTEAMRLAISRHDVLIAIGVGQYGGVIVKGRGEGDSFFAVFERPGDGVAAAADIQRLLYAERWTIDAPLRVRIALHTGEGELRGDDYYGPEVNRCARLRSIAHGGQTLLTAKIAALVNDDLPRSVGMRDLGEHRLRDIQRPERVFQLLIDGLPSTFPPLASDPEPHEPAPVGVASPDERPTAAEPPAAPPARPASPSIQVYLLGGFRLVVHGEVLTDRVWAGRRKARQLFKCLLGRRNRRLTKDEAIELFWPDSNEQAAGTNLRTNIHIIRRVLAGARLPGGGDLISADRDVVGLLADAEIWVDADEFERLAAGALAGSGADSAFDDARLALAEEATELYTGEYLPEDLYEEWASERRETLKQTWVELQHRLARTYAQRGAVDRAVAALERLLQQDRGDERAAFELMQLHWQHGRRGDALRIYQRLEQVLRDELGVEPSAPTVELQRRITANAPTAPPPERPVRAASPPPVPVDTPAPFEPYMVARSFPRPARIVGRGRELTTLEGLVAEAHERGRILFLAGPAGIGKSTLIGELVRNAERAGLLCLVGGCYEQESVAPLAPFRDALSEYVLSQPPSRLRLELGSAVSELARVVPELRYHLDLPPVPAGGTDALSVFSAVRALFQRLAEHAPVLLCLEDLHAADEATLQLLHHLARHAARMRLLLVCTYRSEQAPSGMPLAQLLASLERQALAEELVVRPLDLPAASRLVGNLLNGHAAERLVESLYAISEGNPLFTEQLVLGLREAGRVGRDAAEWDESDQTIVALPRIVREVIVQRLGRLTAECRQMLQVAAVLGQSFEHAVLEAMIAPAEEDRLVADLEESLEAQLLVETPAGYAFSHALLREAVYRGVSGPRRRLLHARAADVLERLAGSHPREYAAELVHHLTLAGETAEIRQKLLAHSLEAGRRAAELSSYREALNHFTRACELLEKAGPPTDALAWQDALEGRGSAERAMGLWLPSIESYLRALSLTGDPLRRARSHAAIGYARQRTGDSATAVTEYDAALSALDGAGDVPGAALARLRLQSDKAYLQFLRGELQQQLALSLQMLPPALALGEPRPLFWAHNVIALAYMGLGQVQQALHHFYEGRSAAARTDDKVDLAIAQSNIGIQYQYAGQFVQARSALELSIATYHEAAADQRAANAMLRLGRVLLAEGEVDRALEQAVQGRALATEAQDRWEADCYDLLGAIDAVRSEWASAEAYYAQALQIRQRVDHRAGRIESLLGLGLVRERRGDWPGARAIYAEAVEHARSMDPCPWLLGALRHDGRLLHLLGDTAAARDLLAEILRLADEMPETEEFAPAQLTLVACGWFEGDVAAALGAIARALAAGTTVELGVELHAARAQLLQTDGEHAGAREDVDASLRLSERLGSARTRAVAQRAAARQARAEGDPNIASTWFEAALASARAASTPYERVLTLREFAASGSADAERSRAMLDEASALLDQLRLGTLLTPSGDRASGV